MLPRALYNLLLPFALLALLPGWIVRARRRGNWRRGLGERFGNYPPELRARLAAESSRWWIHAVSVGEMLVALKLVAALRARQPGLPLVVTTTTTTGRALAEERLPPDVPVCYAPVDFPPVVRRAFDAFSPARLVLVEAEAWPNWLAAARRRGVPAHLVNARLSPRSEKRFRRFRALAGPVFRLLAGVGVPEAADVARWSALGVPPDRARVTGSIKLDEARPGESLADAMPDASPPSSRPQEFAKLLGDSGVQPRDGSPLRPVLLGGSTHAGEEQMLARVFLRLREKFPALLLMIAPRHVERAAAVLAELEAAGLSIVRRSELDPRFTYLSPPDVLLLDSTGELRDWYPLAGAAFVGKSLAEGATGGQNPAEPLAAGVPAVCGPRMENFADLTRALVDAGSLVQAADEEGVRAAAAEFLADPAAGRARALRGVEVLARHQGAAGRTADWLLGG